MATEQADLATSAFPIAWDDPGDLELTWEHDSMHMPFALSPLSIDYVQLIADGMVYGKAWFDSPYEVVFRYWNGYGYYAGRDLLPEPERKAAGDAHTERVRAFIAESDAYWAGVALPELTATRSWFRAIPVETTPLADLVPVWNEAWERVARGWQIHFISIRGAYQITDDLADFYERVVPDAAPGHALNLIQGRTDVLHDVERALDRLASMVSCDPALAAAFADGHPPTLDSLEPMPEAAAFLAELRAFLDDHGHLGGSFDDIMFPSWADDPSMVLGDVARRLARSDPASTDARRAALIAESDLEADRVREILADHPEELDRFEALLEAGRRVGPLTEVHNYWIDRLMQAALRSFALQVGARLVLADVIDRPDDVLFLRREEVPELLAAPVDRRALIAERRATHQLQLTLTPPASVGKPAGQPSGPADRFDGARYDATDDGSLRGTGASAGVARGTARIVLGPVDFGKVRPGDIIVAPSSNPSWVPLFTVAGGLLVNTGGVVCHAAVVAREFGLPAVVGLGDATHRIPDGALVELDGTTGLVRVL